jgi:serine protease Do
MPPELASGRAASETSGPCQLASIQYSARMLKRFAFLLALVWSGGTPFSGQDLLELKENAVIGGRILAEKSDHIAMDVGYTVLMVPRDAILEIKRGEENEVSPVLEAPLRLDLFQTGHSSLKELTVRELVRLLGESVVQVRTPRGLGSGFFINAEGFLITNFHVIEGETQISVEVYHQSHGQLDRKTYRQVRIVAMNKFADLALLKIEDRDAPSFVPAMLASPGNLSVGDRVFAIGSPLGLERTVTEGIVSTKTRQMQGELYLQTTAQINPGNSGGPLFNLRGEVVGVTNMKIAFGEGLGFAIPSQAVKFFLANRDAFAYDNDNPSNPYRYLEPPSRITPLVADRPGENLINIRKEN